MKAPLNETCDHELESNRKHAICFIPYLFANLFYPKWFNNVAKTLKTFTTKTNHG